MQLLASLLLQASLAFAGVPTLLATSFLLLFATVTAVACITAIAGVPAKSSGFDLKLFPVFFNKFLGRKLP
jgi:hypothetical protein